MTADLDYIAVAPCGCWRIWMSGADCTKAEVKRFYGAASERGHEIKRVPTDVARAAPHGCDACREPTKEGEQLDLR